MDDPQLAKDRLWEKIKREARCDVGVNPFSASVLKKRNSRHLPESVLIKPESRDISIGTTGITFSGKIDFVDPPELKNKSLYADLGTAHRFKKRVLPLMIWTVLMMAAFFGTLHLWLNVKSPGWAMIVAVVTAFLGLLVYRAMIVSKWHYQVHIDDIERTNGNKPNIELVDALRAIDGITAVYLLVRVKKWGTPRLRRCNYQKQTSIVVSFEGCLWELNKGIFLDRNEV
jgi:hypothetical protein